MKFTINQENFSDILQQHIPVLPNRTTIPILNSLKWDLKGGKLRMHSTDLEISLVTEIEVDSDDEGSIAVPAKKLSEIVRELASEPVTVEIDDNFRVKLHGVSGVYKVAGSNPEDFPTVPEEGLSLKAVLTGKMFKRMINQTSFAVSHDDMRPTLCGVFFQIMSDEIRTVATDGHRLTKYINREFKAESDEIEAIIPVKALRLAIKSIGDDDEIKISLGGKFVLIEHAGNFLYSRLIEGKYPLYENVIPKNNTNTLMTGIEGLTSSLRRVSIFSNPLTKQIKISLLSGKILISAEDVETGGEADEELTVDYDGTEMDIGFNADYVIEALRHVDSEDVKFKMGTSDSASIIEPSEYADNEEYLMLLMPVRLA